jgi:thiol-disulfide isomerase/thioredoxin
MTLQIKYQEFTQSEYTNEITVRNKLVIVEFGCECCGSCLLMYLIINQISKRYIQNIKTLLIDYTIAGELNLPVTIFEKPTVLIYKESELVDIISGIISQVKFEEIILSHLRNNK